MIRHALTTIDQGFFFVSLVFFPRPCMAHRVYNIRHTVFVVQQYPYRFFFPRLCFPAVLFFFAMHAPPFFFSKRKIKGVLFSTRSTGTAVVFVGKACWGSRAGRTFCPIYITAAAPKISHYYAIMETGTYQCTALRGCTPHPLMSSTQFYP